MLDDVKAIDVPIDQIDVGERRRLDYGDIGSLAKGMKRVGQIARIVVDRIGTKGRYRLIAGERRLKAAQMLKWKTLRADLLENLTEAELRDIELEENENRKSLTERERTRTLAVSKKLVENFKRASDVIADEDRNSSKRGPKTDGPSRREVAAALGTDEKQVRRAEQHVKTAEQFPFMQGSNWKQSDVLRIRERLEELPAAEQGDVAGVLSCAKLLDPAKAVELVENMTSKKPEERREIYRLSESTDPRERSLALTKAAELPPMPDPRIGIIDNACHILSAAIKPFPNDPLTPRITHLRDELRKVKGEVKEVSFDARKTQGGTVQ